MKTNASTSGTRAGGGAYGSILTEDKTECSEKIVAQVLQLSFGPEWAKSAEIFVRVYLEYRRNGLFR